MLVVDTNTVAYFYLDSQYLPLLQAVLERDQEWVAPALWRSELRSVLLLYLRRGAISMDKAIEVMAAAEGLLGRIDYFPASSHVLALALTSGCSAYDCEFVALAREIGTVLITFDHKLLAAFPTIALTPTAFLASTG